MTSTMELLHNLVGHERSLREVAQVICFWAQRQNATAVGALHVTCSDESERECAEAFQQGFVQYMLPSLKFARHSAFQLSNLGGRYEWGAARLAEGHFAARDARTGYTLLIAKINAHVAFEEVDPASDGGATFRLGTWDRYGRDSTSCGAIGSLLDGVRSPFVDDLREAFESEGKDRLAPLHDPDAVAPLYRPLFAAVVSARLQARKVALDIQDSDVTFPSYWLVLPCVTVNRHERDTEILCGVYVIDGRNGDRQVTYSGLGDDPAAFQIERTHSRFAITDDQIGVHRPGRDHRQLSRHQLPLHQHTHVFGAHTEHLDRVRRDLQQNKHRHHHHARALLRIALPIFAQVAPVPAALLAFTYGAAGIHHAYKIHKLADEMKGSAQAREILDEVYEQIDQLDGEHAEALLELLMAEYSGDRGV